MISGVLFDLDGTLLDTAADLISALNYLREREGLGAIPVEELRHVASKGAMGLIAAGMPDSDAAVSESRRQEFLMHYAANSTRFTKPFDGVIELLELLRSRAVPWGVVTNKPEYLTLPLLEATGLLDGAGCVICGDTLAWRKPHPAPVRLACEIINVPPGETLMVGDDVRDIQAGEAAGTLTALAAYGYIDPAIDKLGLSSSYIIEAPREIEQLLRTETWG